MSTSVSIESIKQAALALQPDARVQLAHLLVQSVGDLSASELEGLWLAEAELRDAEMESGAVHGVPGEAVLERIRNRYGS